MKYWPYCNILYGPCILVCVKSTVNLGKYEISLIGCVERLRLPQIKHLLWRKLYLKIYVLSPVKRLRKAEILSCKYNFYHTKGGVCGTGCPQMVLVTGGSRIEWTEMPRHGTSWPCSTVQISVKIRTEFYFQNT